MRLDISLFLHLDLQVGFLFSVCLLWKRCTHPADYVSETGKQSTQRWYVQKQKDRVVYHQHNGGIWCCNEKFRTSGTQTHRHSQNNSYQHQQWFNMLSLLWVNTGVLRWLKWCILTSCDIEPTSGRTCWICRSSSVFLSKWFYLLLYLTLISQFVLTVKHFVWF